jgi:two-component system, OmpR family, phosphate regulon sensor histidine kinase PhoR
MSPPRWRLRPLLALLAAALIVPALFLAERTAEFAVRRAAEPGGAERLGEILGDLRALFIGLGLLAIIAALTLGYVAGARLGLQIRRLRLETAARSRGERIPLSRPRISELQNAAGAVELLATELEKRGDALALERDELALLLNSVSEGILQVDPSGRIVHANPAARVLLGIRNQPTGQPVSVLVRNAELRGVIERAAAGEVVEVCEVTLDDRRLLVAARPMTGGEPRGATSIAGAVIAFTDLTEIRRLEGVRRDFVANVSHELKTPLTSIRGYVETLLTDDLPVDMQRQFLEVIQKNASRLHGIVDDLLDLSRLESGGWRPEPQALDALELVMDVWNTARERTGGKHIEFVPIGRDVHVTADPAGLRQVLANLFDNAIRYTPDGGRITVRVSRDRNITPNGVDPDPSAHGSVTFEIRDTGIGIPHEALSRVFERFYRVDPARSRAEGGTGLGLSIVKHLVESMGGDVTAESDLGKGTTLRVRLPAA